MLFIEIYRWKCFESIQNVVTLPSVVLGMVNTSLPVW